MLSDESDFTIVEADEYDRSFLQLFPVIGVITSMDPDHLDIYGNNEAIDEAFIQFAQQIQKGGTLIIKKQVANRIKTNAGVNIFTYLCR